MLEEIIKYKYEEVKSLSLLKIDRKIPVLNFRKSLEKKPFILEIKKKSPSVGILNHSVDVIAQAKLYEELNAGCISVLADNKFFSGSFKDIIKAKLGCSLPILCKEFIVDEIQIENAFLSGADAILLIAAIHSEQRLKELAKKAESLGLAVLFELHQFDEFEKIRKLKLELVGVNSRNLKTMKIDIREGAKVISKLKGEFLLIAESGIKTKDDVLFLINKGADGFLIGTTIMKSENASELMQSFINVLGG